MRPGLPVDKAFKQAFGLGYKGFRNDLDAYLRLVKRAYNQPKFLYLHFKLTGEFAAPEPEPELLTPAESAFRIGDLLINRDSVHHRQAEEFFRISLSADSHYVPAYLGLSRYALLQRQPYHSLFFLNRGLETGQSYETAEMLTMRGNIFLYLATDAYNQSDSTWTDWAERARKSYMEALNLSEQYIPAHLGLAYYYILCDHARYRYDIDEAIRALEIIHKTFELTVVDYSLARMLIQQGKKKPAGKILREILAWKKDSNLAGKAKALLRKMGE